jgi:hypothetical protein
VLNDGQTDRHDVVIFRSFANAPIGVYSAYTVVKVYSIYLGMNSSIYPI